MSDKLMYMHVIDIPVGKQSIFDIIKSQTKSARTLFCPLDVPCYLVGDEGIHELNIWSKW